MQNETTDTARRIAERLTRALYGVCHNPICPKCPERITTIAAILVAELAKIEAAKWISIYVRLPEIEKRVLLSFARQGNCEPHTSIGEWNGERWDNPDWNYTEERERVTHWQELPLPADEVKP